jgi:hypothetical protein
VTDRPTYIPFDNCINIVFAPAHTDFHALAVLIIVPILPCTIGLFVVCVTLKMYVIKGE